MQSEDLKTIEKDVHKNREALIERLVGFAVNNVLLFWSRDKKVHDEQEKKWTPIIAWVNKTVKGSFKKTTGLEVLKENEDMSLKFKEYLNKMTDKELSCFYVAALNMRSVLLALALVKGKINALEAFELSELEELYQARMWGTEPTAETRRNNIKDILICTEQYLRT